MEDIIDFVFSDLIAKLNDFAVNSPRNALDLTKSYQELESILREYREMAHFIEASVSLNED